MMRHWLIAPFLAPALTLPAEARKKGDDDAVAPAQQAPPAGAPQADPKQRFVEANLLETLYHELGHALVDVVPIELFGPEEFAVDFFAALMLDRLHDEATTRELVTHVTHNYALGGEHDRWDGASAYMWDVHGKPMQRYYNLACLYYGADPQKRGHALKDFGLPDERAETCAEEHEMASFAWNGVLESLEATPGAESLKLDWVLDEHSHATKFLAREVDKLNALMTLPKPVNVSVIPCGEVNAFYDPSKREILMCTELAEDLAKNAP